MHLSGAEGGKGVRGGARNLLKELLSTNHTLIVRISLISSIIANNSESVADALCELHLYGLTKRPDRDHSWAGEVVYLQKQHVYVQTLGCCSPLPLPPAMPIRHPYNEDGQ